MHSSSHVSRKWHRLGHKYGKTLFFACLVVLALVAVGFLMYLLTDIRFRARG